MKSMKLSAIVLGLAAASAFAQAAPTAAPAAQPADSAKTEAAQPAEQPAEQPAAAPATDSATVAAPKAEEPKTEEVTEAKAEEPKAEEKVEVPAEEAKTEEVAKADESKPAEASLIDRLNISKADPAPESKKAMEFKISGQAEFDTYINWKNDSEQDFYHTFWSTVDLDFQVKFNDQWSAQVEIEADGEGSMPSLHYNGAFIQFQPNENLAFKLGDLTYSEGAFNYYGYIDPAENAAGMVEHDVRGLEVDFYGLQFGIGLTRSESDYTCDHQNYDMNGNPYPKDNVCRSFDIHGAYQFDIAGQMLRPYVHYQNWQEGEENEFHAGLDAALEFGPFAIHAVYGLHKDNITNSQPDMTHTFLAEPTFKVANVSIKGGFFYAYINEDDGNPTVHEPEIPEYMFAYGEGDIKFNDIITLGLVGELHTNSLSENTDLGTLNFGLRSYFTPVDGLEVTAFAMGILPMGDDWEKEDHAFNVSTEDYGEDLNLKFGIEAVFSF